MSAAEAKDVRSGGSQVVESRKELKADSKPELVSARRRRCLTTRIENDLPAGVNNPAREESR